MSTHQTEDAALGLLGGRAQALEADRAAACEAAHRLQYVKVANDGTVRDIAEIKAPTNLDSAAKYAQVRVDRVLNDPASTQADRAKAYRLWSKAQAAIKAVRDGEAEFAGAARSISTRLAADRVRAAEQAKAEAAREAAIKKESDRKFLSRDEFALKYGVNG